MSYLAAAERSPDEKARLRRILRAAGAARLAEGAQGMFNRLRPVVLRPEAAPATVRRELGTPILTVFNHAFRRGWCEAPYLEMPRAAEGRTRYLLPGEAERLVKAAAPHLKGLAIFLLCTGARMSEALGLEWRDVDLTGARAIFWADQTKSGRRRTAFLPARAVASIAGLPRVADRVFTTPEGQPYPTRRERGYGGQVKTAFAGAIRRAGLDPALSPHDCRHSWASWHYALWHDPVRLKSMGGWASLALVERYTHLMPEGHEAAIREFWGIAAAPAERWA